MKTPSARSWCAKGQYPGKRPFTFGHVVASTDMADHEIDDLLLAGWRAVMPHEPPKEWYKVPGVIIFYPEE